jgi:uncharacterized protein
MASTSPFEQLPEALRIQAEAHAFRSLIAHFQERPNVQNMETMTTSGFCRNCLSKWLLTGCRNLGPLPLDQPLTYDDVSNHVYGMSPKEWKKKYQLPATEEQLRRYEESKQLHATHDKNVLDDVQQIVASTNPPTTTTERILDPCCPDSTEAIPVMQTGNNSMLLPQCSTTTPSSLNISGVVEPPPMQVQLGVLTVSDRAYNNVYKDQSGPLIEKCFKEYSSKHLQIKLNVSFEKVVSSTLFSLSLFNYTNHLSLSFDFVLCFN